ncbi:hypothetical protein [Sphingopyxis panaciterrulae]|uniref:Protocatechuate 4,5-dioxygenase beta chain n=1 Tax=Sphingopyxis panaciterrulae TaxID=462372 RepID=A0A7W9B8J2_9SPHN|nr:hypothetical protein [Sphingopyxis panaciterrulae]MBB5708230.1 protocatechuate 4,5-dioxygenase beta chain [Sphingopyxis panaciterrulae]
MSIVLGVGLSYSPLMYRPQSCWSAISDYLVGDVVQPAARESETSALLADYERRIASAFDELAGMIGAGNLDALILLHADRGDVFDLSNTPQLHLQVGGEIWSDLALSRLGEEASEARFTCDEAPAELLAEELVRRGFDISEGRALFLPLGGAGRGVSPAAGEAGRRLAGDLPLIPLHVNCHVEPTLPGLRLHDFGRNLAQAAALTGKRFGLVVSGGLSGDPGGAMGGWIDDVLDRWVLTRLVRGQSRDIAGIWDARSRTLQGNSAEIRLWTVAGAALEESGCRARLIDYMPVHHGATGMGFMAWETPSCR